MPADERLKLVVGDLRHDLGDLAGIGPCGAQALQRLLPPQRQRQAIRGVDAGRRRAAALGVDAVDAVGHRFGRSDDGATMQFGKCPGSENGELVYWHTATAFRGAGVFAGLTAAKASSCSTPNCLSRVVLPGAYPSRGRAGKVQAGVGDPEAAKLDMLTRSCRGWYLQDIRPAASWR